MLDLAAMVHQAIALLHQHQPWIVDKAGGATVTQAVRELWDQVKSKLGGEAVQKVEQKPDDAAQWELFQARLLLAIDQDQAFAEKVHELLMKSGGEEPGGISQRAQGNANKQVAVKGSQSVNVRVK